MNIADSKRRVAGALSLVVVASLGLMVPASPAEAAPSPLHPDRLELGEQLNPNESLISSNHCFKLTFQSDGNLVVYMQYSHHWDVWATNTVKIDDYEHRASRAVLQKSDGNFVVYHQYSLSAGVWHDYAPWATNTVSVAPAYEALVMQGDGNLVLFGATSRVVLWASGQQWLAPASC